MTATLALTACGAPPQQAGGMPPAQVGVASPIARELPVVREFTGRIEAVATVELRPRVGGTIAKVLVADGAPVTEGQPLFEIDRAPFEAALARAEADLARAQARLTQATLALARAKDLRGRDIVAQSGLEDAEAAVGVAKADLAAATAALAASRLDLDHTSVRAPVAGRLGRVLASAGNTAQAAGMAPGTLLATLVTTDPVYAVFDLDEATFHHLAPRLRASAEGGAPVPVQVGGAGEPGLPHAGRISVVDNVIDSTSGAIRLRATLAGSGLTPGAYVRVALEVEPARPVLLVNEKVLLSQMTTRFVYTVDDKGITAFRPVQVGEQVPSEAGPLRVINGVGPTDRIAVNNLTRIFFPGMPVVPVPADMASTQNAPAPAAGAASPAEGAKP